jgi:iron(III) transport system permease protein
LGDLQLSWHTLWTTLNVSSVWTALIHTAILAVCVPIVTVTLGTLIVYLSDRVKVRTGGLLSYLATAPLAVPGLVMGTGFLLLFIRTSLYGSLVLLGLGMVGFTLTHAVRVVGNGMGQLDRSLEEASLVCGVSRQRTLWSIMLPLLRPSLLNSFVLIFALSSLEVAVPLPLYTPSTSLISIVGWENAQQTINHAATIGLLQIAFLLVGLGILQTVFRTKRSGA